MGDLFLLFLIILMFAFAYWDELFTEYNGPSACQMAFLVKTACVFF